MWADYFGQSRLTTHEPLTPVQLVGIELVVKVENLIREAGSTVDAQTPLPLITIIVATYNAVDVLADCIRSIDSQTYRSRELIVIDGGSTDGTVDLLEEHRNKLAYFESASDRGIADAWNKGLRRSRGGWVLFLGADDRLYDEYVLQDMASSLLSAENEDVVYGEVMFANGIHEGKVLGGNFDWRIHKRRMLIPHTSCFHRRSLFEELGAYDESYQIALDYEFLLRKCTLRAKFVRRIVTLMGGEGISTVATKRSRCEARRAQFKNRVDTSLNIVLWFWVYRFKDWVSLLRFRPYG